MKLSLWLGLVFCLLWQSCIAQEPSPRWKFTNEAWSPAFTKTAVLIQSTGKIIALDRATGKRLWEISESPYSSWSDNEFGTAENALIGTTQTKSTSEIIVIAVYPPDKNASSRISQVLLKGITVQDGKSLWSVPIAVDRGDADSTRWGTLAQKPLGVYGETLVLSSHGRDARLFFRSAVTGQDQVPAKAEDREFLRRSAEQTGTGDKISDAYLKYGLLKIAPDASLPFQLSAIAPKYDGSGTAIGKVDNKILVYSDTDQGGAGQSSFPKFVICYDTAGKIQWIYPRRPKSYDWDKGMFQGNREFQLETPTLNAATRSLVVPRWTQGLTCLDTSTKRILWKRKEVEGLVTTLSYGQGFLYCVDKITAPPEKNNLRYTQVSYLDGRTGKVLKMFRLPAGALFVAGGDLLLIPHDDAPAHYLACYSLPELLK